MALRATATNRLYEDPVTTSVSYIVS